MIQLVFDNEKIEVQANNPLFSKLMGHINEVCEIKSFTAKNIITKVSYVEVSGKDYYNLFNTSFSEDFRNSSAGKLLKSHLDNILFESEAPRKLKHMFDASGLRILESPNEEGLFLVETC